MRRDAMALGGFEHDSFEAVRARGHRPERMNGARLAARFPAWKAERFADGYLSRRAGWAESGEVVARLATIARDAGVVVRERTRFVALDERGGRLAAVAVEDAGRPGERERVEVDAAVLALGAWTPHLLPELRDVMWAVGQPVLHFRPSDASPFRAAVFPPWAADISRTGWYGFPVNASGIVKVANHGEGVRVDPAAPRRVAPQEAARFRAFLRDTFPALAEAPLAASRLCLYCDTWDGDFWIDHHASCAGAVVAAGDSGHAFKFAPILGALIAGVVEERPDRRAARFARRSRGAIVKEAARHLDARGSG
jgi:glycine/D-amino acid oxidase-like deaminating enzyme